MKFLDQIAELETKAAAIAAQVTALITAKEDLSNTMGDAARQVAELQRAIADAPRPFTVEIKQNGEEFTVSEKDGMALFAALVRTLEGEKVSVRLAAGQTPTLGLTDLEQVASKILEAMA